ncbi:MAG: sigma factor-like helix-turn-helix DNA-binding protein [Pseudomonadota bacterium]
MQWLVQTLPQRERDAFLLTDIYGFTGREAADVLGATPAAAKMAASRARKRGAPRSMRETPN